MVIRESVGYAHSMLTTCKFQMDRALMSLQKEDVGGKLISHLHQVGVYDKIPYSEWFTNCFSTVLPETTFER